jgi:hypothetical protein
VVTANAAEEVSNKKIHYLIKFSQLQFIFFQDGRMVVNIIVGVMWEGISMAFAWRS